MRVAVDHGGATGRRVAVTAIRLRAAVRTDAAQLHALIGSHVEEGHLLPRGRDDLAVRAPRFVVAVRPSSDGGRIVGCAELAPLSPAVAEVRSLVVSREARRMGLGRRMLQKLTRRARREGVSRVCAFTHDPSFFVRLGFSIAPHTAVPEKIAVDCRSCPLFRNCGQYAVVFDLRAPRTASKRSSRTSRTTLAGTSASVPVESRV